jgi:hypothetical protein
MCRSFRDLIADLQHLCDLMTSWTFFNRDLETRPFGNTAASGHFQHSDMQIGSVPSDSLTKPKPLLALDHNISASTGFAVTVAGH